MFSFKTVRGEKGFFPKKNVRYGIINQTIDDRKIYYVVDNDAPKESGKYVIQSFRDYGDAKELLRSIA
jgi:hypothetical protein